MKNPRLLVASCAFLTLMTMGVSTARGSVVLYSQNKSGFIAAAPAAGIRVNFDNIAPGTNIANQVFGGMKFVQTGAPLIVVRGADTETSGPFTDAPNPALNKLLPTSGENVLSPGGTHLGPGPDPAIEDDSLTIIFDPPVRAFGFDHISQSADGFSFTSIAVKNSTGNSLFVGSVPISTFGGGGAPAGADFWGIVSSAPDIASVVITEGDNNSQFPDCNIGYDTILTDGAGSCAGDLNSDGQVDDQDFILFVVGYNILDCADPAMPVGCPADLNNDSAVNDADFVIFVIAYNQLVCP